MGGGGGQKERERERERMSEGVSERVSEREREEKNREKIMIIWLLSVNCLVAFGDFSGFGPGSLSLQCRH